MKRKPTIPAEPAIPEDLIEQAKQVLGSEQIRSMSKCVVCGGEGAPNSTEGLCWVCRRLKISAWRDSDPQMTVQE